jgi:hypothetical protein
VTQWVFRAAGLLKNGTFSATAAGLPVNAGDDAQGQHGLAQQRPAGIAGVSGCNCPEMLVLSSRPSASW